MDARDSILELALDSLRFECLDYGIARMNSSMSTGWRSLPFAITSYCRSGRSLLRFDGGTRVVRPRETICLAPGFHHCADIPDSRTVTCWNHINWKVFGAIDLLELFDVPLVISGDASKRLGAINSELLSVMADPAGVSRAVRIRALGLSLLAQILSQSKPREDSVPHLQALSRVAKVLRFIDARLDQEIGRDELAECAHLSNSRFNTVFRNAMRQSPREYIRKKRLQRAQHLLISTELAINEIAARAGHPDPFHFTRMFKKACGVSPTHYRQNARAVRL
jgi:AraC-like DNA-binding protein